jgi:catalase-peroxidase
VWEPEKDIYWGTEEEWLGDTRIQRGGSAREPARGGQMGLIYVNPEGPAASPTRALGRDIARPSAEWA